MKEVIFNKQNAKRVFSLVLVMAMFLAMLPGMADAASIDDYLFDAAYYDQRYPDLHKAFNGNAAKLRNHFNTYGKKEGRSCSDIWDPEFYLSKYSDLRSAFGRDYVAAYNHFVTYGIREGRQGSATFSVEIYKSNYADLRSNFGTANSDNWEYIRHWHQYGRREGRNATSKIGANTNSGSTGTQTTTTMYVKTSNPNNRLNMRSSASTSASIVERLPYGMKLTVYSTANGWAKVKSANGKTGYVSTQYLSSSKPSNTVSTTENGSKYIYTTVTLDTSSMVNWIQSLTKAQNNLSGPIESLTVNETRKMNIEEPLQGPTKDGTPLTRVKTINAPYRVTFKVHVHERKMGFGSSWRYADGCIITSYKCQGCDWTKDLLVWEIPLPDPSEFVGKQITDTIRIQAQSYHWMNNLR